MTNSETVDSPLLNLLLSAPSPDFAYLTGMADQFDVRFGDVDVAGAASHIQINNAINSIPRATVRVDPAVASLFDYAAPMIVTAGNAGDIRPLFTGEATAARVMEPGGSEVDVTASGMSSFSELKAPSMASWGKVEIDVVHLLARTSGLSEDQVLIQMKERPLHDVFEVARPILACELEHPIEVGNVRVIPAAAYPVPVVYGDMSQGPAEFVAAFSEASAIAVTYVSGNGRLFDVESEGSARIQQAAAWLRIKSAYSASMWPGWMPREHRRNEMRAPVRAAEVVLVKGLVTNRAWLRSLATVVGATSTKLDRQNFGFSLQPLDRESSRLAVAACARASEETLEPMARVGALWEALEFFASAVSPGDLFSRSDRRAILKNLPDGFSEPQRQRLEVLIGQLNSPPLMAKVRSLIEQHRIPVSEGEFSLLLTLRKARNDAVHGRGVAQPTSAQLSLAVSVVARMLVYRAVGHYKDPAT